MSKQKLKKIQIIKIILKWLVLHLLSENLTIISSAVEQKVAITIHRVSDSNQAIDMQRPLETLFDSYHLYGEDLQGTITASISCDRPMCISHGGHRRCKHKSYACMQSEDIDDDPYLLILIRGSSRSPLSILDKHINLEKEKES